MNFLSFFYYGAPARWWATPNKWGLDRRSYKWVLILLRTFMPLRQALEADSLKILGQSELRQSSVTTLRMAFLQLWKGCDGALMELWLT
jgi:hypothetical protein